MATSFVLSPTLFLRKDYLESPATTKKHTLDFSFISWTKSFPKFGGSNICEAVAATWRMTGLDRDVSYLERIRPRSYTYLGVTCPSPWSGESGVWTRTHGLFCEHRGLRTQVSRKRKLCSSESLLGFHLRSVFSCYLEDLGPHRKLNLLIPQEVHWKWGTWIGQRMMFMSPWIPCREYMEPLPPVVTESTAFLFCKRKVITLHALW